MQDYNISTPQLSSFSRNLTGRSKQNLTSSLYQYLRYSSKLFTEITQYRIFLWLNVLMKLGFNLARSRIKQHSGKLNCTMHSTAVDQFYHCKTSYILNECRLIHTSPK